MDETTATIHIHPSLAHPVHYKGKQTHRSWPQLPDEIVRLITTYYLCDVAFVNYCPQTWESRRMWYSRMVYACVRDVVDLERHLLSICPEWRRAIETHLFWNQAISIIDPNDALLQHRVIHPKLPFNASSNTLQQPIVLTSYQYLRNLLNASCIICRINSPWSNVGLCAAKRVMPTLHLGNIGLCREHHHKRTSFCGLCFRDAPLPLNADASDRDFDFHQAVAIIENEDEDTWPGIEATCRRCRTEWLWRKASSDPRDRRAVGGPDLNCNDWETRQTIDGFIELSEGTITDVLTIAREKLWLRLFTKYEELGQHHLAQQRQEVQEDEDEEEDEEEHDAMLSRASSQVRQWAVEDWARKRIMDGHWISPADVWYDNKVPGQPGSVDAALPCIWEGSMDTSSDSEGASQHPSPEIVKGEIPPTFQQCEQAYLSHIKKMREILFPALRNVVRKLVMEAQVPVVLRGEDGEFKLRYEDPGLRARKMTIEDVVSLLRNEAGLWYDGVDWAERKRSEEEIMKKRRRKRFSEVEEKEKKEDDADSTTSSSSSNGSASRRGSSIATSPVLSTTTLQTTPSPPPLNDDAETLKKEEEEEDATAARTTLAVHLQPRNIPIDPVKPHPRPLGSIPRIPHTTAHLPHYSMEAIKNVWRDACAPLYHCQCNICERAKLAEKLAREAREAYAAAAAAAEAYDVHSYHQQGVYTGTLKTTLFPTTQSKPHGIGNTAAPVLKDVNMTGSDDSGGEIILKEINASDVDGEGEEEVDYDEEEGYDYEDEYEEEEEEYEKDEFDFDDYDGDADFDLDGYPSSLTSRPSSRQDQARSGDVSLSGQETVRVHQHHQASPRDSVADAPRSRKRSIEETDPADDDRRGEREMSATLTPSSTTTIDSPYFRKRDRRESYGGTPPKRARIGDSPSSDGTDLMELVASVNPTSSVTVTPTTSIFSFMPSVVQSTLTVPNTSITSSITGTGTTTSFNNINANTTTASPRSRKRRSEELTEQDAAVTTAPTITAHLPQDLHLQQVGSNKRVRVGRNGSGTDSPAVSRSSSHAATSSSASSSSSASEPSNSPSNSPMTSSASVPVPSRSASSNNNNSVNGSLRSVAVAAVKEEEEEEGEDEEEIIPNLPLKGG